MTIYPLDVNECKREAMSLRSIGLSLVTNGPVFKCHRLGQPRQQSKYWSTKREAKFRHSFASLSPQTSRWSSFRSRVFSRLKNVLNSPNSNVDLSSTSKQPSHHLQTIRASIMTSPITPLTTTSHPCIHLDSTTLHALLAPHLLIPHFRATLPAFSLSIHSPPRLSYTLPSSSSSASNALLLMPCWSTDPSLPYLSVKTVTVFPSNSSLLNPLPGIHAAVSLFHSLTGAPLASLDGTSLTFLRTSAIAGLASSLLSIPSSQTLLIIGSGGLAQYLISAHRAARPTINRIFIWNRTVSKAQDLVHELRKKEPDSSTVTFDCAEKLDEVIGLADIVSCATSSTSPIVKGRLLKPGAHLDLVGSFTPTMKECDDEALLRGRVFVDFEVAMDEAGELVGAFERGVLRKEDVAGTLTELAGGKKEGRKRDDEVTVFNSVGTAVVDLLAAQLAYESCIKQ